MHLRYLLFKKGFTYYLLICRCQCPSHGYRGNFNVSNDTPVLDYAFEVSNSNINFTSLDFSCKKCSGGSIKICNSIIRHLLMIKDIMVD